MRFLRLRNKSENSLNKNADFNKLWFGETISLFGAQVTELALPLMAITTLDASPTQVGLLSSIRFLPFILVTLILGAYLDRTRRRPVMIISNFSRGLLLLTVPLLYIFGSLTITYLYILAFFLGFFNVAFELSYFAYLPRLVNRNQLNEGNSKLQASASIAGVGGEGIAGILIQLLTAPIAIVIDAISYLIAGISLLFIKQNEPTEKVTKDQRFLLKEIKEGLKPVFSNPYIVKMAGEAGTYNFFTNIIATVFIIYAVEEIGLSAGFIGIILASTGIGAFIGAMVANKVNKLLKIGPSIIWSTLVACSAPFVLLFVDNPSILGVSLLMLSYFLSGFGVSICNVNVITIRQSVTPDNMLSRMNASYRMIVYGGIPLGAFLGGYLGDLIGLYNSLMIGVLGMPLCVLWLWFSPMKDLQDTIPSAKNKEVSIQ